MANPVSMLADDLQQAHAALLEDLQRLEESLHGSPPDDPQPLRTRLGATQTHLLDHFRFEEQDGYMDAFRKQQPRLEHAIGQLAEEHGQLRQALEELIAQAGAASCLDDSLREGVRAWVRRVRQHEARETGLVQEAVNRDIGTKD